MIKKMRKNVMDASFLKKMDFFKKRIAYPKLPNTPIHVNEPRKKLATPKTPDVIRVTKSASA